MSPTAEEAYAAPLPFEIRWLQNQSEPPALPSDTCDTQCDVRVLSFICCRKMPVRLSVRHGIVSKRLYLSSKFFFTTR